MSLLLDSANLDDARAAASYGFVSGATTNPSLLVKGGHTDPQHALRTLCGLFSGTVFYQLTGHTLEEMRPEAETFTRIAPNLGLKIPCTITGLQFAAEVSSKVTVAVTAVFAPSQAYLASQAGARYVIPFVNRVTRQTGDGPHLVSLLAQVLSPSRCEILAAGIKSPAEAVDCLLAGAHHISVPLAVIQGMAENVSTQQAIADFDIMAAQLLVSPHPWEVPGAWGN